MKTVLVTSSGCPGAYNLISNLGEWYRIVAVDMDENVISKHIASAFYTVPPYDSPNYVNCILNVCKSEKVDIIFPESSYEVEVLSRNAGIFSDNNIILVASDYDALHIANNKYETYKALRKEKFIPRFVMFDGYIEDYIYDFGYPKEKVCIKPAFSKGSRGFKILDSTKTKDDILRQRDNKYTTLEFIKDVYFENYIIMEYIDGEEIDSMILCDKGKPLLITHKTRENENRGTITYGKLVHRPYIDEYIMKILEKIPLSYNISMQFKGGKLIEINPRTSTYIWGLNPPEPVMAIKLATGEMNHDEIMELQSDIPIGRKMIRYFTQYCW